MVFHWIHAKVWLESEMKRASSLSIDENSKLQEYIRIKLGHTLVNMFISQHTVRVGQIAKID